MREFYLYTYDKVSYFNLNTIAALAVDPSGLGNNFETSYNDTDDGKYLVNVTPSFDPIKTTIYFNLDGTDGYKNYKRFLNFIAKCGTSRFLFEYNDGVTDKFCEVVVKSLPKTEIDENGLLFADFQFERQTYWYEDVTETFSLVSVGSLTNTFALSFPFGFTGKVLVSECSLTNSFFVSVPITVTITGNFAENIYLYIADSDNNIVSEIQLSCNNTDGQTIVIEPSTKKITITDANGVSTNGYSLTDKTKQSFLYLPQGTYKLGMNIQDEDTGSVKITAKKYLLD